jgi:DNA-binding PadR family transcriptional regulator
VAIDISEFESCTLAAIRQRQPCSAYEIRQLFARSTTPDWSGTTGSIYPAIARLLERGLIAVEPQAGDRRGRRDLTITPDGAQAVRDWLTDLPPWIAKATPDPIRTRTSFLDQLGSDSERIAFLGRSKALSEEALLELIVAVEALKNTHTAEYLAGLGAIAQVRARLTWLREVLAFYGGGITTEVDLGDASFG